MIAFEEELKKFDFFNIDSSFKDTQSELVNVFREVNSTLGRISKEQDKANIQLEEIMLVFDEIKEKDETIKKLEKSLDSSEREKLAIIKSLIEILDEVENLYRLSMKEENESWHQQVSLMWGLINKVLFSIGMTRIDDENTMFNPLLNNIVGVKSNIELGEGIVLEVLKSGYTYKGMVLRKSEVIVNKHMAVIEEQRIEEQCIEGQCIEDQCIEEQNIKEGDIETYE
ncbi:MAG: nucleotide exchange factor GrpE [Firmicutes bacterium]|nr:nucleotide exchange factor GrpE [Bacillota bacterium]